MSHRSKILCIEDDPGTRELLEEELAEAGFAVHTAADGESGLTAIAALKPDLVLCDIDMPRLTGFEVLERLRRGGAAARGVPFVFLTAYGARDNQIRGRRLGCDDYVTKPIDFELLVEIVRSRLARTGSRPEAAGGEIRLTDREAEALTWSARGKSSADIAVLMAVSERTVNFHIDNAIRKLGVATRIQAAVKGALLGLVAP
ncbi:response regulator transcription factor [Azospirillum halopraeferens]|uniref:response regulator transcription factor n=1 Tax=Azospirillum halopraeferens TaxID=34010 RepID=UPI00040F518F|nr:response regulator transcription factor [Azospirillum halopraeferens]